MTALHRRSGIAAIVAGLALLVVAARLPFLGNLLIDEEGCFAYLVLGPAPVMHGDIGIFQGRIDGVDRLLSAERNPLPYWFLDRIVRPTFGRSDLEGMSIAEISRAARLPFFALFLGGAAMVLVVLWRHMTSAAADLRVAAALVSAYALTTPLAVGGSIQPQLDGGLGVLLAGAAGGTLLLVRTGRRALRVGGGLLAGFVAGLAKTEWAIALAAAILAGMVLFWIVGRGRERDRGSRPINGDVEVVAAALVGLAVALAAVALVAPEAMAGGFSIARRAGSAGPGIGFVLRRQIRFMYPAVALGIIATVVLLPHLREMLRRELAVAVIAAWGAAICTAYLLAGWMGDGFPRYYMPGIILLTLAAVVGLARLDVTARIRRAVASACLLGLAVNAVTLTERAVAGRSITSVPGAPLAAIEARFADNARRFAAEPQVFLDFVSFGIYHRNVDFVGLNLGADGARFWVERWKPGFSGALVPPDR